MYYIARVATPLIYTIPDFARDGMKPFAEAHIVVVVL